MAYKYRFLCMAVTQKDDIIHIAMLDDEMNTITDTKFEVIESEKYIRGIESLVKTAEEIIGFNLNHEMEILKKYGYNQKHPMLDLAGCLMEDEGLKNYDEHGNLLLPFERLIPYTGGMISEYIKDDALNEAQIALLYFDNLLSNCSDMRKDYYPEDDN